MTIRASFVLGWLIGLAGCAPLTKQMYDGPRLSAEDEAVLTADGAARVYILAVDGKSTEDWLGKINTSFQPYVHEVYVLPGWRDISATYLTRDGRTPYRGARGELRCQLDAGKKYLVHSVGPKRRGYDYEVTATFWLADPSTGKHIPGICIDRTQ